MISKNNPTPIWQQLAIAFRAEIRKRGLGPHERFASESEITREYGVSRMTVRRALADLTRTGELYARAGKGTFVAPSRLRTPLGALTGFSEKVHELGLPVSTRILLSRNVTLSGPSAQLLAGVSEVDVFELRRLRLVSDVPIALQTTYVPSPYYVPLFGSDFSTSLSELLKVRCGIELTRAEESIEAAFSDVEEAALLDIAPHSPVLRMRSLAFSQHSTPIRLTESTYRGDAVTFTFTSSSSSGSEVKVSPAILGHRSAPGLSGG